MFLNEDVDAIMAVGGGTCNNKILPYLDMELIASHPKPLVGISNITALLLALENAGIVAFHGPFLRSQTSNLASGNPALGRLGS